MSQKPSLNQSKTKDEKMPYFKDYKHRGHNGTRRGHAEWKSAGELYFASEKQFLLARILDGTFDPMPLVESWPFKPVDWSPTIIGKSIMLTDGHEDPNPTAESIELDEVRLLSIQDEQERLQELLNKLQDENVVNTPKKGDEDDGIAENRENTEIQEEKDLDNAVARQGIKTDILKCRVKAKKLRDKISRDIKRVQEMDKERNSPLWSKGDVIFQDNTRMNSVTAYANEMETASDLLMLWMSATASDVIKGSIKKMEVGYKTSSVKGFIVLDRLNLKFGKDTTATGNVGLIGKAVSLKFLYGAESATEYLDRMLDMLEQVVGYDELLETVKKALPTILLGRIHDHRFGTYCELATKILLDKEFMELSIGPYKDFRAMLHTTEQTMKCFVKSKMDVKARKDSNKSKEERANGSKSSKTKKNGKKGLDSVNAVNDQDKRPPHCHNCENSKPLLSKYGKKPHKTGDCPFEQSKKQRDYYHKDKIVVDKTSFPEFAHASKDNDDSESQEE